MQIKFSEQQETLAKKSWRNSCPQGDRLLDQWLYFLYQRGYITKWIYPRSTENIVRIVLNRMNNIPCPICQVKLEGSEVSIEVHVNECLDKQQKMSKLCVSSTQTECSLQMKSCSNANGEIPIKDIQHSIIEKGQHR
jgi:hypothetical protein